MSYNRGKRQSLLVVENCFRLIQLDSLDSPTLQDFVTGLEPSADDKSELPDLPSVIPPQDDLSEFYASEPPHSTTEEQPLITPTFNSATKGNTGLRSEGQPVISTQGTNIVDFSPCQNSVFDSGAKRFSFSQPGGVDQHASGEYCSYEKLSLPYATTGRRNSRNITSQNVPVGMGGIRPPATNFCSPGLPPNDQQQINASLRHRGSISLPPPPDLLGNSLITNDGKTLLVPAGSNAYIYNPADESAFATSVTSRVSQEFGRNSSGYNPLTCYGSLPCNNIQQPNNFAFQDQCISIQPSQMPVNDIQMGPVNDEVVNSLNFNGNVRRRSVIRYGSAGVPQEQLAQLTQRYNSATSDGPPIESISLLQNDTKATTFLPPINTVAQRAPHRENLNAVDSPILNYDNNGFVSLEQLNHQTASMTFSKYSLPSDYPPIAENPDVSLDQSNSSIWSNCTPLEVPRPAMSAPIGCFGQYRLPITSPISNADSASSFYSDCSSPFTNPSPCPSSNCSTTPGPSNLEIYYAEMPQNATYSQQSYSQNFAPNYPPVYESPPQADPTRMSFTHVPRVRPSKGTLSLGHIGTTMPTSYDANRHDFQGLNRRRRSVIIKKPRPFACSWDGCNKTYMKRCHLTEHDRTHTGIKPFVCHEPGCSKSYSRAHELTRHNYVHTKQKNYLCWICGKRFIRSCHMTKHIRTIHRGSLP